MKLYHQTGHNYVWNIQSYVQDKAGDGIIFSPLNIEYSKLKELPVSLCTSGLFDPQLFMPSVGHKGLLTYDYFPTSIINKFSSSDYSTIKNEIAKRYIEMLMNLSFKKVIIPNKYIEIESTGYYDQVYENYIKPHCDEIPNGSGIEKYLTVILNNTKLIDDETRDSMLDWLTGLTEIDGFYLLFDIKRTTKQIKDPEVLAEALFVINVLKRAGKKVIIGYTNTEGILYSIANPDAITCGSYENLRNFSMTLKRFSPEEKKQQHGPNARLYSALLYQWIEYPYIAVIKQLYPHLKEIFPDSKYRPLMFTPTFKWNFQKSELYKHYFIEFYKQVSVLSSNLGLRKSELIVSIKKSLNIYSEMNTAGILFDGDSDGSHLIQWINAVSIFEKISKERL